MGWTYGRREKGVSNINFFRPKIESEGRKIIDVASTPSEVYFAYQVNDDEKGTYVICVIAEMHWNHADPHFNFGYKLADEMQGPRNSRCPERILDQLTPIEDLQKMGVSLSYAANWRARCREAIERKTREKQL